MALIGKHEVDIELKTPADKLWSLVKEFTFLCPKIFPDIYHSIEVLEGDGRSAGSLRRITLAASGEGLMQMPVVKSRIEAVDEETKTICYRMVEGDILKSFKSFVDKVVVKEKDGGGSVVSYSSEYEKLSEDTPNPDHVKDFTIGFFHKFDAYLEGESKN